jgi:peptide methionine sulfoxide reductase MsrA
MKAMIVPAHIGSISGFHRSFETEAPTGQKTSTNEAVRERFDTALVTITSLLECLFLFRNFKLDPES